MSFYSQSIVILINIDLTVNRFLFLCIMSLINNSNNNNNCYYNNNNSININNSYNIL